MSSPIRVGDKFRITRKSHHWHGRVFRCAGYPHMAIKGNRDTIDLVWRDGELIEFNHYDHRGKPWPYLIRADWCERVKNDL